jgi:hypothetical protein
MVSLCEAVSYVERSFRDSGSFPKLRRGKASAYLDSKVLILPRYCRCVGFDSNSRSGSTMYCRVRGVLLDLREVAQES